MSVAQAASEIRLERLAGELSARELDLLLVYTPVAVRYLTSFTGTSALLLVAAEGRPAGNRFFTDFRYATQSGEQVPERFEREIVRGDLLEAAARSVASGGAAGGGTSVGGRLGFDDATLTVAQHARLRELLGPEWELVPFTGAVERLRAIKDAGEIARIRAACELADAALSQVLERGLAGRTEREVALDVELAMRNLGAEGPSFPVIVAAGAHGALPHAEPRATPIARDVLVTIDWGALHEGYCSDCTRTYASGERLPARAREVYQLVESTQAAAVAAVRAGPTGRELDAVARELIEAAGEGDNFGHGLGHGVGMEIHERPRLSRTAGEEPVRAGNVVTVEPGVYVPGQCGVRIEDLLVVRADGSDVLTSLPRELTVVA